MRSHNMGKAFVTALCVATSLFAELNVGQKVLIDFGNDSSFRGLSVDAGGAGIDENGNYWNSVWSGAYYANMKASDGSATTIDFGFGIVTGTDSFNGPAGATSSGTLDSDALGSAFDGSALGLLGSTNAVFDYYAGDNTFTIQGLDPTKTYNLTFYGSHKYGDAYSGLSTYTVYTSNDYSTVVASDTLAHNDEPISGAGDAWKHNQDRVATITGLSAQYANSLWVRSDGYLNAMSIEVVPPPTGVVLIDFGKEDGTNGDKTVSPDSNGNYWNNSTDVIKPVADMVDSANYATGIGLSFTNTLSANGKLSGGLLAPSSALLGNFAVADATEDYFFTTSHFTLKLTGLNSGKAYNLRMFGTRNTASTRETTFTATGGNGISSIDLQTSGTDIGNDGIYDGNDNTIVTLSGITPDINNEILIDVAVKSGGYAYLGILEITEVPGPTSSGIDLRAYQAADGVYVEFVAYDVEADGEIKLALLDANENAIWTNSVNVAAAPSFIARFLVPGLEAGGTYDFSVRDEVGKWWSASGIRVETFAAEMMAMSLEGVTLAFDSLPDRDYEIQWVSQLGDVWQTVDTVSSSGERTAVLVPLPYPNDSLGFFRVKLK